MGYGSHSYPSLSSLKHNARCNTGCSDKADVCHGDGYHGSYGWVGFIVGFFILWLVVFLILVAVNPKFLHKKKGKRSSSDSDSHGSGKDGDCDFGSAALASFVIALVLVILFGLFWAFGGRKY